MFAQLDFTLAPGETVPFWVRVPMPTVEAASTWAMAFAQGYQAGSGFPARIRAVTSERVRSPSWAPELLVAKLAELRTAARAEQERLLK